MSKWPFTDLFESSVTYPDPTQDFVEGVLLEYIGSPFLDGWLRYIGIAAAYVVFNLYGFNVEVAAECIRRFTEREGWHTFLNELEADEVVLLGRDKSGTWWYFSFDSDVSDCSIGKINLRYSEEKVLAIFEKQRIANLGEEIPLSALRGGISW